MNAVKRTVLVNAFVTAFTVFASDAMFAKLGQPYAALSVTLTGFAVVFASYAAYSFPSQFPQVILLRFLLAWCFLSTFGIGLYAEAYNFSAVSIIAVGGGLTLLITLSQQELPWHEPHEPSTAEQ